MPLGIPGESPATSSDVDHDRVAYYRWLSTELKHLHTAVKQAREDQKVLDKQMYDKAHKQPYRLGRSVTRSGFMTIQ